MPSVTDDWLHSPLTLIDNQFSTNREGWEKEVGKMFSTQLAQRGGEVPYLCTETKPGTLVRYHCMVQDVLDREFYMKQYIASDKLGNEKLCTGKYSDTPSEGYTVQFDHTDNKLDNRMMYYCVPVPGLTSWARAEIRGACREIRGSTEGPLSEANNVVRYEEKCGTKRGVDEEEMDTTGDEKETKKEKKQEGETEAEKKDSSTFKGLNLVLPSDSGVCSMVMVYDDQDSLKINDVIEVYGIVERLPQPEDVEMESDDAARFPPSSLVPRLHVVRFNKCSDCNPLCGKPGVKEAVLTEAEVIRSELLSILKQCLYNDPVAAEYLLLHLTSHIYGRQDVMAIGKFTLNITGCKRDPLFHSCLTSWVTALSEKCFSLPLTLTNLNNVPMLPAKDYKANRLVSGALQLSHGTQLILDETCLEPGQLKAPGIENLKSLGNLISWQKLSYDFGPSYDIQFECDTRVLTLSEAKSLLPSDILLPLKPMLDHPDFTQIQQLIQSNEMLNKFRMYLTLIKGIEYSVNEDVQKIIEDDFVQERKANPTKVTGETLHRLLVTARLNSLTHGHTTLTPAIWAATKALETDRVGRLS